MTLSSKSKHALKHTHLSATFTAALYNNRPWNLFPLREPRRRPKKEKRLGIVSSYVTWMSNNFGARGCRISNVEAAHRPPTQHHAALVWQCTLDETMRDKEKREEELQFSPGKNVWRVIITGHPLWFILSNYP